MSRRTLYHVLPVVMAITLLGTAVARNALSASVQTPQDPRELTIEPLGYNPPTPEQHRLACGIPVYLVENHSLPLLYVTIEFHMGTHYLPLDKLTVSELMMDTWKDGGTESLTPKEVDEQVAALDASLYTSSGNRYGQVGLWMVKEDSGKLLPLWAELVMHPRFDPDRLERARKKLLDRVQSINSDPATLAQTRFEALLWGDETPPGRVSTAAQIAAVDRRAILALYHRFVHPENAVIGVAGDVRPEEILPQLDAFFGDWRPGPFVPLKEEKWEPHPHIGVFVLPGEESQSQVMVGRVIPDFSLHSSLGPVADVFSFALGYGRVYYRTRDEGLSYATGVFLFDEDDHTTMTLFGATRTETTGRLIESALSEIHGVQEKPLTQEELETARIFHVGRVVQRHSTAVSILVDQLGNIMSGRGAKYTQDYVKGLQAVTTEDLANIARSRFAFDDSLVVFVLGDTTQVLQPLRKLGLGKVQILEPIDYGAN